MKIACYISYKRDSRAAVCVSRCVCSKQLGIVALR